MTTSQYALGDERGSSGSFTPALPALHARQLELAKELRTGFASREALLLWMLDVAKYTIGRVDGRWYYDLLGDRWKAAMLLNESAREGIVEHPPDDPMSVRLDIYQDTLLPASRAAVSYLRTQAQDHTEDARQPLDGEEARFTALRPRVDDLASDQRRVIEWAFDTVGPDRQTDHDGPITNRADMLQWAGEVQYSTRGLLPPGFADEVVSPASRWWGPLLDAGGAWLQLLVADELLPVMNRAIRHAAQHGEELAAERNRQVNSGGSIS